MVLPDSYRFDLSSFGTVEAGKHTAVVDFAHQIVVKGTVTERPWRH